MIHIVGGTYREKCVEPYWDNIFGSAGRAASALSELTDSVYLTTYIGENEKKNLEYLAGTFGFHLENIQTIPQTVSFSYYHCLTDPFIWPEVLLKEKYAPLLVSKENIVRYGLVEGNAVVHGKKVIYDPQNEYNSELFTANGSTAEKLAIIANISECQKLTGSSHDVFDAKILGEKLLALEKADVIVVKQGSLGALVLTPSEMELIPAYQTTNVFSIGSGDIFTAVFAHFWISGKNPVESASLASLATAFYCDTRRLPIPINFENLSNYQSTKSNNAFPIQPKYVYLAGPFFTMAERWMIDEARKHLYGEGFNVFSPLHDVGYGEAEKVAPADIKALGECDIVFAILDNLDSGTIFEIGYARSLNKPVIAFVQSASDKDLTMIRGSGCEVVGDFASAIYRAVWTAMQM